MQNTITNPRPTVQLSRILGWVLDGSLYAAVVLIPLFYLPFTQEALEINKQTLLVILAVVATVAWLAQSLVNKSLSLSKSWLHLAIAVFGLGYLLVCLMSDDRYLSLVGGSGQTTWSFVTIAALALFYLVGVNRLTTLAQVYNLIFVFFFASFLAAVYGLLQMFGIFIFPGVLTKQIAFTTVGSTYGLAIFLVVPLVMASALALHGCRDQVCLLGQNSLPGKAARVLVWLTGLTSLAVILLVDLRTTWGLLFICIFLLLLVGYLRSRKVNRSLTLIVPIGLLLAAIVFSFTQTPYQPRLPSEITPSLSASWSITQKTLQVHPLFGSGPGTWIYDYAKYRVQMVNQSPFWSVRFDRGYSSIITLLAANGLFGFMLWLMLLAAAVAVSWSHLVAERRDDAWYAYLTVFVGFTAAALTAFVYNFNFTHQFVFWLLLALLGALSSKNAWTWEKRTQPNFTGALAVLVTLITIGGLVGGWLVGQRYVADAAYAQALTLNATPATEQATSKLTSARTLNPFVDAYARSLSQAHLLKVIKLVNGKPAANQRAEIQNELATAIDLGREAIQKGPANVDNWTNLAMIYQNAMGFIDQADELAINNYAQAIQREPQNPVFATEVGKIYFQRAETERAKAQAKDAKLRQAAQKSMEQNLDLAATWLHNAVALKSDYLPARYYLSAVYERQGHLKDSITELEGVLVQNNRDAGLAFELAILYYRDNQKVAALQLMEKVVQADASNANARWYLASMYDEAGRLPDAIEQIKQLQQLFPDNAAIAQRLADLQQRNAPPPPKQPLPEPLPVVQPQPKTGTRK